MKHFLLFFIVVVAASALPHRRRHSPRIFGGNDATQGQFPFVVALNDASGYQWCDGAIINSNWILTTGACGHMLLSDDVILTGTHIINNENGTTFKWAEYFIHTEYDGRSENNIALIKLDGELVFDDNTQPIEIGEVGDNATCTITGWGSTENELFPNVLQYAEETTIDRYTCEEIINDGTFILEKWTICAMGDEGVGACFGDTGGPLVCDGKLAGLITSAVLRCGTIPDVFTRVMYYKEWMDNIISLFSK